MKWNKHSFLNTPFSPLFFCPSFRSVTAVWRETTQLRKFSAKWTADWGYLHLNANNVDKAFIVPFVCLNCLNTLHHEFIITVLLKMHYSNKVQFNYSRNWWFPCLHGRLNLSSQTIMDKGLTAMLWLTSRLHQSVSAIPCSDSQHPILLD